jgi:phosphoglycerate dehydrogenase-like enzyme
MQIVFHGANAASFSDGFSELLGADAAIAILPDELSSESDRAIYAAAHVIVGVAFNSQMPKPEGLRLFHVPGAGFDAVELNELPNTAAVCNCFGHEQAIAEYVMTALLMRQIPIAEADRDLRQGRWTYWAGAPERVHGELAGKTVGLLGYGHIGKAIATRAKAFEMSVIVANRSAVAASGLVDQAYSLEELPAFFSAADAYVISLPLTPETTGLVGREAFAAMRSDAVIINVGRGPTVDEQALFDALEQHRIGGAIIDTWYRYPSGEAQVTSPGRLPFERLQNVVMTPHMSGWTKGTIRRRQGVIVENIRRRMAGLACINVIRAAHS